MSDSPETITALKPQTYSIKLGDKNIKITGITVLIAIMVLATVLRVSSAIYQGNNVIDLPGVYDQISYDGLARRVINGYGFSFAEGHWPATRAGEPTAHWSYLYTLYLAVVYKIFGTYPLIARIIQALIAGILQTWLIYRIGKRIFGTSVGLIAAFINAIYIYFFYYAGALITETFYITCILWIFDASFRIIDTKRILTRPNWKVNYFQWLELGIAISLTVLLRQLFFLFLPFLFIWIWWNEPHHLEDTRWKQRLHWPALRGLTISTGVLALMILPFTIRNFQAFDTFVLLNTNAGFAFFWGNHPIHGTSFMPLLPGGAQQYYDLIPKDLLPLNEAKLDKALLSLGIQFVLDDPVRFILLSISRLEEYFKFWPTSDSGLVSNISRVGSFGISLPFILYGLWLEATRFWKSQTSAQRWSVILLLCFALVYTSIHLISWTLIRYRLPIDAVLLIFAALSINYLADKFHSRFIKSK